MATAEFGQAFAQKTANSSLPAIVAVLLMFWSPMHENCLRRASILACKVFKLDGFLPFIPMSCILENGCVKIATAASATTALGID